MKIVVCIKQVPGSTQVNIDPDTGVLIRDGKNVKMNPYDLYALETSFLLKERLPEAKIEAITMGPPSAKAVLQEALYMGADAGTLVSDRRFAGADCLATSYTLSQLINKIDDTKIIICGKQTTDGDTAQVGPEIAEFLGIPHVAYVTEIIGFNEQSMTLKTSDDDHDEIVQVSYPFLMTVDKAHLVPRLPSYKRRVAMKDVVIKEMSLRDFDDQNPDHYGLNGSPTQVEEIFPPEKRLEAKRLTGTKAELANALINLLKTEKFI